MVRSRPAIRLDKARNGPPGGASRPAGPRRLNPSLFWIGLIVAAIVALMYWNNFVGNRVEVTYDFFQDQVDANNVAEVDFNQQQVTGRFRKAVPAPKSFDEIIAEMHDHAGARAESKKLIQEFKVTLPLAEIDKSSLVNSLKKNRVVIHSQSSDGSSSALIYLRCRCCCCWRCGGSCFAGRATSFWGAAFCPASARARPNATTAIAGDHVCRRGRPGRRQARPAGSRRVPQEPRKIPAAGRPRAQGRFC